jgi:hypothetical protein
MANLASHALSIGLRSQRESTELRELTKKVQICNATLRRTKQLLPLMELSTRFPFNETTKLLKPVSSHKAAKIQPNVNETTHRMKPAFHQCCQSFKSMRNNTLGETHSGFETRSSPKLSQFQADETSFPPMLPKFQVDATQHNWVKPNLHKCFQVFKSMKPFGL